MEYYRERMVPTLGIYLATALVIPASLLVFLPINILTGYITAVVLYAGSVITLVTTAPVLVITDSHFTAGRARVPLTLIGDVEAFRKEEATLQRGQRLDARAWIVIRGWISPVVRVEVTDPADPVPYWLVSSRHPEQLVELLKKAVDTANAARPDGSPAAPVTPE